MNLDVLKEIEKNWGIAPVPAAPDEPAEPQPAAAPGAARPRFVPEHPEFTCEKVGRTILGQVSDNVERDTERLIELMRAYPIKPHLHAKGGSGFSYPYEDNWAGRYDYVIKEFAALWWTAAGDEIIARYGQHMEVCPPYDPENPYKSNPKRRPVCPDSQRAQPRQTSDGSRE